MRESSKKKIVCKHRRGVLGYGQDTAVLEELEWCVQGSDRLG